MKTNNILTILTTGGLAASALTASAHIVSLGWRDLGSGTVDFIAQHWHGSTQMTDGVLIFDGISYPFTSVTSNTPVQTGLDGALVNSSYATFDAGSGTLTTLSNPNWLNVTITGIGSGSHTVTAPNHPEGLTDWTLDGDIDTFSLMLSGDVVPQLVSGMRAAAVAASRSQTQDVKGRLTSLRSGMRSRPAIETPPMVIASAKGSKGGMAKTLIAPVHFCPWEAWGQIHYSHDSRDAQYDNPAGSAQRLLQPDTRTETYGGTVGVDYDLNQNWTVGVALGVSHSDVRMKLVGDLDIDSLAIMPYVSYVRPWGENQVYLDFLYAYGDSDYDTKRTGGVTGDTSGNSHSLELNGGVNIRSNSYVHGPLAQVRWLDGEIDAYTEKGLGGLSVPQSDYKSLATQIGYQASRPISLQSGTLVPQVRVAWEHEFEADQGQLLGSKLDVLDEDLGVIGVSCAYYTSCGWNALLGYEARLGSDTESHYVGIKIGREF